VALTSTTDVSRLAEIAAARIERAIVEATAVGALGENIMGSDFTFTVELRRGAGAYICGEETALIEAIEGKRGFPRIRPPFPTTHGLFGKPTVINNVETLCQVPGIIARGGRWFRQWGIEGSAGAKLVAASGHVKRPGGASTRSMTTTRFTSAIAASVYCAGAACRSARRTRNTPSP